MTGSRALVLVVLTLALVPPAASAQVPAPPSPPVPPAPPAPPPPTPPPAPQPVSGKATIAVARGLATKEMRYAAPFQQLVVRGRVKPYVQGETVTLNVVRRGKVAKRIRRAVGRRGRYSIPVKLAKTGSFQLFVRHARTPTQQAFRSRRKRVTVVDWQTGQGERGLKVMLLQRGLHKLGFSVPVTGYYDWLTANAVNAFRKTNGMGRDGYALKSVYAMVFRGEGAYRLRYPKAGKHVEFDWSRQVLVLADKGRPYRVYHSSSGTPATPTVFGSYRFYLQTPGTNDKGMVHSSYFIGGYAIHGYASVPNYPASHGCLRVPIPNAASIFGWIDLGDPIYVYR
jgi:L,D-transpeptidase catalytic domain/Putative peptidoglycan binding domain